MIKKIRAVFEKYMIRPMLYQCATKISIALVLCLLWDKFIRICFLCGGYLFPGAGMVPIPEIRWSPFSPSFGGKKGKKEKETTFHQRHCRLCR